MKHLAQIPTRLKFLVLLAALSLFAGLAWVLYYQATFLHVENAEAMPPESVLIPVDSISYGEYTISNALDPSDSTYGVVIFKGGRTVWNLREGSGSMKHNTVKLIPVLGNKSKQVFVEQFSGGAQCCWTSVILDLSDSVRVLFNNNDYTDLGDQLSVADLDRDGFMELNQAIIAFDYFDRISHEISTTSHAYFRYSAPANGFVVANREFSKLVLNNVEVAMKRVRSIADTADFNRFEDVGGTYLASVLKVLSDYVYAGQAGKGWEFFDRYYRLSDKEEMRRKIEQTFESSSVYQQLYYR